MLGIFGLPLAKVLRYAHPHGTLGSFEPCLSVIVPVMYLGRMLGFWAESWVISSFLDKVLDMDIKVKSDKHAD